MDDERRLTDPRRLGAQIRLGDGVVDLEERLEGGLRPHVRNPRHGLRRRAGVDERAGVVGKELGHVVQPLLAPLREDGGATPSGLSGVFSMKGKADEIKASIHALAAMSGEITDDLRGAHGVSDQHHVMEVQLLEQRAEVVRERIVVIPASRIAAPTVAALVVGDAARMLGERDHLILPDVTIDAHVHETTGLPSPQLRQNSFTPSRVSIGSITIAAAYKPAYATSEQKVIDG